ncbi:PREDICTED: TMV resistance protein N-like isoform X2 [Nelumbo nucifera]|uniref:TMV resistance protein N-like isoform X2 n=1 Tax=Nelumbo nucifera TaxID=4432 RepID=A0A1U7Z8S8_NELNU|nr:PREDICTED: TMV resistance protein N-like isoform X2 [Nelumbo nucifera]
MAIDSPEAFPPVSSTHPWKYDVFLSFRGEETRRNFTDHLYTALSIRGIYTFRDDEELQRGREISSALLKAIEESRICIIVFSESYASSRWCLDELVKIMECEGTDVGDPSDLQELKWIVLPIFYKVDPSDVRKQTGSFGKEFSQLKKRFKSEVTKVHMWERALRAAADLSGWNQENVANGHESKFIEKIVNEVWMKLNKTTLDVVDHPVGIHSRVNDVCSLLNLGSNDVRIVGIWGMGGIGKTTIAKAVYNQIFNNFEGSSFLEDVRERSRSWVSRVELQEQLLSDILMIKDLNIGSCAIGTSIIKGRLRFKKVLLVLDDVDGIDQLKKLAGDHEWFGKGSRIIITTRDDHLLNVLQVDGKYKVKALNDDESIELFSWHAFNKKHPIEGYSDLSTDVVRYVEGLPLALKVWGSHLCDITSTRLWENELDKLKKIPHGDVQGKLRTSFDALDYDNKEVFLDIACFFIGMDKHHVIRILEGHYSNPEGRITDLIQRSLLKQNRNKMKMHDQIRDMGREIVRQESPRNPGRRTRLWSSEDIVHVLGKHKGSEVIRGLILENYCSLTDVDFGTEAFVKMTEVRLLQLNNVHLTGDFEHLPKELTWLCWNGFALKFIPADFHLKYLVILEMQHSKVERVWEGIKVLEKLKYLNLSYSQFLMQTPNFLGCPSLEILILEGCSSLVEIHESIGNLNKLVILNLKDCKNLMTLPSSICNLTSLKYFNLHGCKHIGKFPSQSLLSSFLSISSSYSYSLERLDLRHCNLSEGALPSDLRCLSSLKKLYLSFNNFSNLPSSMNRLSQLHWLELNNCTRLQSIPGLPSSLQFLEASGCTSLESISNLGSLTKLRYLNLQNTNFVSLPVAINQLLRLDWLKLEECSRLQSLPVLPSCLKILNMNNCTLIERLDLSNLQRLSSLQLKDCRKLVDVQFPESLVFISDISMNGCSSLENTSWNFLLNNILQDLQCEDDLEWP